MNNFWLEKKEEVAHAHAMALAICKQFKKRMKIEVQDLMKVIKQTDNAGIDLTNTESWETHENTKQTDNTGYEF